MVKKATRPKKPKKRGLSDKQDLFCNEYLVDLNATQAAIRAKYSKKTAYSQGQRLLKHVEVEKKLSRLQHELREKAKDDPDIATPEEVLQSFTKEHRFKLGSLTHDDGSFKLPHELDPITQSIVSGVDAEQRVAVLESGEKTAKIIKLKYKIPEKFKSREAIARHFGLFEKDNRQKRITIEDVLAALPEQYRIGVCAELKKLVSD